jgi:hypothetical protein
MDTTILYRRIEVFRLTFRALANIQRLQVQGESNKHSLPLGRRSVSRDLQFVAQTSPIVLAHDILLHVMAVTGTFVFQNDVDVYVKNITVSERQRIAATRAPLRALRIMLL